MGGPEEVAGDGGKPQVPPLVLVRGRLHVVARQPAPVHRDHFLPPSRRYYVHRVGVPVGWSMKISRTYYCSR